MSNPTMSLMLLTLLSTYILSLLALGKLQFTYHDFRYTTGLNFQNSLKNNNQLLLAGKSQTTTSSVWYSEIIDFTQSFHSEFTYIMSGGEPKNAGDGLTFTVQSLDAYEVGLDGSNLGYGGLSNSISLELDTFKNTDLADPDGNHISLHTRGSEPNSPNEAYGKPTSMNQYNIILNDGNQHTVSIQYDSTAFTWTVKIDDITPIIFTSNIASTIGNTGYVGFTAATGGLFQDHILTSWSFGNTAFNCGRGFQLDAESHCVPITTDTVNICPVYSSCSVCTTSPYACSWTGSYEAGSCAPNNQNSIVNFGSCPAPASYTWIWIVSVVISIVVGASSVFFLWRMKQQSDKDVSSYRVVG